MTTRLHTLENDAAAAKLAKELLAQGTAKRWRSWDRVRDAALALFALAAVLNQLGVVG